MKSLIQTNRLATELLTQARDLAREGDEASMETLDQIDLFFRDKNDLIVRLYHATGTWDDFMSATGFGSFSADLRAFMAAAQGREYEREPQDACSSIDEVNEKLKRILVTDKQAMSIHAQLMDLESKFKELIGAALKTDSARDAQFAECLNQLLKVEVESLDWIRTENLGGVSITADPSSPEAELYSDIAIGDSKLSSVVKDGRMKWNHTATTGSPNDEPVMHWAAQKKALMKMRYVEMHKKLSWICHAYISYFHEDRASAEEKWIKDLQEQFAQKPNFVEHCLLELAAVYEYENRMRESNLFRSAATSMSASIDEIDGDLAVPSGTLYLHVPNSCPLKPHIFWQSVWAEADSSGVDYQGFSMEGFQTVQGHAGEFTKITIQSADQVRLEEIAFRWLRRFLDNHSERSGPFGEILVERNGKFTVWPEK